MNRRADPAGISALWAANFDAYAAGEIPAEMIRCVLCEEIPCDCPEFGTDDYFELIDKRHGCT